MKRELYEKPKEMRTVINVDATYFVAKFETALRRFLKKYPELDYWKEMFEWMYENDVDYESNSLMSDNTYNPNWTYTLRLDAEDHCFYFCVIEREQV